MCNFSAKQLRIEIPARQHFLRFAQTLKLNFFLLFLALLISCSDGRNHAPSNNVRFFNADNNTGTGRELWKTDGTEAGTRFILDIYPGVNDSFPDQFLKFKNKTFFIAINQSGFGIYSTNGTSIGTELVKNFPLGIYRYSLFALGSNGENLYFSANDGVHGYELWKTDGTETGTVLVKDINPGTGNTYFDDSIVFNGALFLSVGAPVVGGLWRTDGTESGTVPVKYLNYANNAPANLTIFQNSLFFSAADAAGSALWKSDGTENGTELVKMFSHLSFSATDNFVVLNDALYFSASVDLDGRQLWKTDGTESGTERVSSKYAQLSYNSNELTAFGVGVYFVADDGISGAELWKSDGTDSGTMMVKDINPGSRGSQPRDLMVIGDLLFFVATSDVNNSELWVSDGTEAGTKMVKDINPYGSSDPRNLLAFQLKQKWVLHFTANDGIHGRELWQSDGTESGTFQIKDICPGYCGSTPG